MNEGPLKRDPLLKERLEMFQPKIKFSGDNDMMVIVVSFWESTVSRLLLGGEHLQTIGHHFLNGRGEHN